MKLKGDKLRSIKNEGPGELHIEFVIKPSEEVHVEFSKDCEVKFKSLDVETNVRVLEVE